MNYAGITASVPFPFKRKKLFFSFEAEAVIMDQQINLSNVEGVMQFSLWALLSAVWTGLPLINAMTAVGQKLVLRTCFKFIFIPPIRQP